ncbi:Growth differentiation factor 9 isoform 2 [Scophthalmus maximus]|uniref:Growth differentiation factor 9 n=1 Tax=Scophthalmus maximus TaxID=52904 RepID=A0A2U9C8Z8_SCOMX|nr:Growth differentiation factor 9 [Scophthalmus maximus]AWP12216.1 Growth differentiation factor 9 isoform 2 [Scophthalmus maximus]
MEKQMMMSAALRCLRTVVLLLLVADSRPLVTSSLVASNALRDLGDLNHPYNSILSPLLKALSQHGAPSWNPGLKKKKMKLEPRYIKYLTEVYKKPSVVQRSLDGNKLYNSIRLIKPRDECLAQSIKESCMQELSYSLDQVKSKEQLLKSALLYNFDHDCTEPLNSVCYLRVKEQEQSNQCQLCPVVQHAVNFTNDADRRGRKNWVEVDVTSFVQPLLKFEKKNIHLLINITCPEEQRFKGVRRKGSLQFTLRPPPLLLYLNDISKITHQKSHFNAKPDERPSTAANMLDKQMVLKPGQRFGRKRRWKRQSLKSKQGSNSANSNWITGLFILRSTTPDTAEAFARGSWASSMVHLSTPWCKTSSMRGLTPLCPGPRVFPPTTAP